MMTSVDTNAKFLDQVDRIADLLAPSLAEDWPKLPVVKGEGVYLFSADGRRYLDFTSGLGVVNIGHSHPHVIDAVRKQIELLTHSAVGITLHETVLKLCEALPEVLPSEMDMFFFGTSGAEAVEGAIKLARYVTRRPAIIAFEGGFHGRSYGAASVTSIKSKYRLNYEPFVPSIYFAPYAYPYRCPLGDDPELATQYSLSHIHKLFDHLIPSSEVAAFIVEPIQGEGGYIVPPVSFLKELRQICNEAGILLIFDEVQTGFGRTGEMFAAQVFDVQPDIMAIAKGIASGFPLSATVASRELMMQWKPGSHGTTFGGNPVACAAALATLEVIREEGLLENCRSRSKQLLNGLYTLQKDFSIIGEVRGIGLMVAMEMITPGSDKEPNPKAVENVLNNCLERDLLAYVAGNQGHILRLIPPLCVTYEQIEQALIIIRESLETASK